MTRYLLLLCLLTGLAAGGCAVFKGSESGTGEPDAWEIRPVAMRIYPASRFGEMRDRTVLNAQLELFDQMGDSMKGTGSVRFELHAHDPERPEGLGRRLYSWRIDLTTLAAQKQQFNRVTRTYLFHLTLKDREPPPIPTVLHAIFTPTDGPRLEATAVLATGGGVES